MASDGCAINDIEHFFRMAFARGRWLNGPTFCKANMNVYRIFLSVLIVCAGIARAAVPPAEQLLPADSLFVFSIPDWGKAKTFYKESPQGQLWQDAEMKPFKDKFMQRLTSEVIEPLERELGVKLADYADLFGGQVTVGLQAPPKEKTDKSSGGMVLLVDTLDKSEQLKTNLVVLKKKWTDAGKLSKTDKIRDIEFTTLMFTEEDLSKTLKRALSKNKDEKDEDTKSTNKVELIIGQSGSLLLVGNDAKYIEKVLIRQSGGQLPAVGELPEFQSSQAIFKNAIGYGWLNLKPLVESLTASISTGKSSGADNPMMPKPDKVLAAMGLDGLKTLSGSLNSSAEGSTIALFLNVPESNRKGLVKLLALDAKDASPPAFVPADAVKFNRWRLDGQKTWASLEAIVTDISPEMSGALQMMMGAAGKDKDANFDLKKALIGNLGDDIVSYQKNPKDTTFASLNAPPAITLLGSANADQLAQAIKTGMTLMMPPNLIKEREFLGRKIVSIPLPGSNDEDGPEESDKTLNIASSSGYVAISTDSTILEEYLRSNENKPKPLKDISGLAEAAQKVGGMGTGFWGYENQSESMRITIETLKKDTAVLEKMMSMNPLGGKGGGEGKSEELKTWFDFALLPPFEKISKYFHYTVYAASTTPEGMWLRYYSPVPPGMKK